MATMLYPISTSEKTRAVKYLIDHIPDETLSDIAKLIREDGKDWWLDHMDTRSLTVLPSLRSDAD